MTMMLGLFRTGREWRLAIDQSLTEHYRLVESCPEAVMIIEL